MKMIDSRLTEISNLIDKHINSIVKNNRAEESVELLSHLRNYCEAVFYKLYDEDRSVDLYQTQENLTIVRTYIKNNSDYKKLYNFHQFLDCREHVHFGIEQAEALMIKYVPYLIEIKILLKTRFNIDNLLSIDKYPLNLDDSLIKFYRKILFALNLCKTKEASKSKDLYYIHRKSMKYIDGQVFYEYVLDVSDDKPTKFNTVVAYSKLNIDLRYDMVFKIYREKINFLNTSITINIINDFDVSIRPCAFNTISEMYKFGINLKSRTKPYLELMDIIKKKNCTILDMAKDNSFLLTNNDAYASFISLVRNFLECDKKGSKLLKYLLQNMRYSVIKGQVNHHKFEKGFYNPYFDGLKIASGSLGFESNPIAISPLIEQPTIEELSRFLDFSEYKHEFLYREIKNYINTNNSLFVDPSNINYEQSKIDELVEKFNSSLCSYYSNYKIIKIHGKYTIQFYYEASIKILSNISNLKAKKNVQINYVKDESSGLSEDKIYILENAFANSSICFVTGAAGTGKTTLIHEYIKNNPDKKILCLTTTNTAKNNLKNNYGTNVTYLNAAEYKYNLDSYEIIVVDEASFVSTEIMSLVFERNTNSDFLIVGDPYQIESIEFGNWFKLCLALFKNDGFIYSLDSDHRAKTKELQKVWDAVRNIDGDGNNKILELMSAFNFAKTITEDTFNISDNQVMLCLNYDGLYGINNLNRYLQCKNANEEYLYQQNIYKIGDPVVFVINDFEKYGLYNNIAGKIINIASHDDFIEFQIDIGKKILNVEDVYLSSEIQINSKGNSSIVTVKKRATTIDDYDDELTFRSKLPFQLAYAMSIHKAQGLEFEKVKIIITSDTQEYISRNIFYTAITRAKHNLEIYWDPEVPNRIFSNMIEESKSKNNDLSVFKQLIGMGELVI